MSVQPPQLVSFKRFLDLLSCPGWPIFSGSEEKTFICSWWWWSVYFNDFKVPQISRMHAFGEKGLFNPPPLVGQMPLHAN